MWSTFTVSELLKNKISMSLSLLCLTRWLLVPKETEQESAEWNESPNWSSVTGNDKELRLTAIQSCHFRYKWPKLGELLHFKGVKLQIFLFCECVWVLCNTVLGWLGTWQTHSASVPDTSPINTGQWSKIAVL